MRNRLSLLFYAVVTAALLAASSGVHADAYTDFFRSLNIDNDRAVRDLLVRGFDPNTADESGQPALMLAVRDDSPRVAALLLAHPQIRVDATNASNETPLMIAAIKGNLDWTRKLLDRGAQVNRPGWTPLHYAASGPEVPVVALLLERGATVDALSPNGTTPLMMASRYGAQDAADLLLQRGADARLRNKAGLSAADFARQEGRDRLAARLDQAAR